MQNSTQNSSNLIQLNQIGDESEEQAAKDHDYGCIGSKKLEINWNE